MPAQSILKAVKVFKIFLGPALVVSPAEAEGGHPQEEHQVPSPGKHQVVSFARRDKNNEDDEDGGQIGIHDDGYSRGEDQEHIVQGEEDGRQDNISPPMDFPVQVQMSATRDTQNEDDEDDGQFGGREHAAASLTGQMVDSRLL